MITLKRETLFDVVHEVDDLLRMHYDELTMHKDKIVLDPKWDEYRVLEQLGRFVLFTARDDGNLIGYSAFFVVSHMHYASTVVAINDVLFLHPDYRKGLCGIKLIKFSESHLREMGAHKCTWHVKRSLDWAPILHRLGYADEEMVVGKMLQGE